MAGILCMMTIMPFLVTPESTKGGFLIALYYAFFLIAGAIMSLKGAAGSWIVTGGIVAFPIFVAFIVLSAMPKRVPVKPKEEMSQATFLAFLAIPAAIVTASWVSFTLIRS